MTGWVVAKVINEMCHEKNAWTVLQTKEREDFLELSQKFYAKKKKKCCFSWQNNNKRSQNYVDNIT